MLSDYNCKILEIDRYHLIFDEPGDLLFEFQKIIDDINLLGSCGFHKLVFQFKHPFAQSPTITQKSIRASLNLLKKYTSNQLLGRFKIFGVPVICLTEDTPYIINLEALSVAKTNYIFLELPIDHFNNRLAIALNRILYNKKLLPVFTDFHVYSSLYKNDELDKLIKIKGAAFQFSIRHSILPNNVPLIKHILNNGGIILLGTSCDHDNLNVSELTRSMKTLKKQLGNELYMTLIMRAHAFMR